MMNGRGWMFGLLAVMLAGLIGVGSYYLGRQPAWDRPLETSRAVAASPVATGGKGLDNQRVALVIGNSGYAERPLTNPPNDARAMTALLRQLGFTVTEETDLALAGFRQQVNAFLDQSKDAELRLFYYSGHGANYRGKSYLLPIGHGVTKGYQLPDQGYPLETLLRGLQDEAPGGVNLILLDACRDAPFGDGKSIWDNNKGLAPITKEAGTLIAYAAQPGKTASDNSGGSNSLFTKHLLAQLNRAEDLGTLLTRVTGQVSAESHGEQLPEISLSLTDPVWLKEPLSLTTGILAIKSSQPSGVVIYVDGARLGEAPQELGELPAGKAVTVTAKQLGYEDYQERVWIRAGQRSEINVVLTARSVSPPPGPPVATPAPEEWSRPAMTGPAMVKITGGCFEMGSPASETGREPFEPNEKQHRVCVKNFEIGKDELTVGEFKQFITASGYKTDAEKDAGGNEGCFAWSPSDDKSGWHAGLSWRKPGYDQRDNYPVVCVSWNDALAYTGWLSEQTGQSYRLPTEAEWEYAARAGTTMARHWGDDPDQACQYANVGDQTSSPEGITWTEKHECKDGYWYPAPVDRFKANDFGLNDLLGNVWEWTCSAYDQDYGGAEKECNKNKPVGALAVRGGGWNDIPAWVRSAVRSRITPAYRSLNLGFRLARSL